MPGTPALGGNGTLSGSVSGRQSDIGMLSDRYGTHQIGPTSNSGTESYMDLEMTPRFMPDLIDVEQELFELPRKVRSIHSPSLLCSKVYPIQERVLYNKDVQTMDTGDSQQDIEEDFKRRQLAQDRDIEAERMARDRELEEESVKLEQEIEQEIRGTYRLSSVPLPS